MTAEAAGPAPVVEHVPEKSRYEITVEGTRAGHTDYVEDGGRRIFYHTEIGEAFGGHGLAGTLVGYALADTRDAGLRIVPVCPYVAKYVKSHHDFDDVLDAVTPGAIAVVESANRR